MKKIDPGQTIGILANIGAIAGQGGEGPDGFGSELRQAYVTH